MIRVNVDGVSATVIEKEILTAGRVGLECAFTFAGEWGGLFKTAVFQGVESVDVALPDNTCVVPWEAMQVEGVQLKIGVFGANGEGTIVIPTVWANAGKIQPSAIGSGTEPSEPSQNANAYAVETAEEAKNIALSVQQRANDGEFDGADGAAGADGFSPTATVSKAGNTATITITDKDGTTTASINDGVDGSTLWTTTVEPAEPIGGGYEFYVRDLTGVSGGTPAVGDIIFYDSAYYPITSVTGHSVLDRRAIADTRISIRGATGPAATDEQVQTAVDAWLEEHPAVIGEQVQDAVDEYLSDHPTVTGTFSNEAKNSLLTLLEKVAYTVSDGQTYLDALRTELFRINVDSISAVFTQGSAVIYDTDPLDTLKQYLVVTANYSDGTSAVVTTYTLSGTLEEGTSTITVSYGGKTDTFDVVVSIGLDSIAYGSMTYRDIFITNNLFFLSDFEGEINLTNSYIPYEGDSDKTYKINAGSPSITQEAYNSASHSLKAFGSGSSQIVVSRAGVNMSTGQYLTCVAVNCSRYSAGKLGIQWGSPMYGTVDRLTVAKESTTNGFEAVVGIMPITVVSTDFYAYVGSMSSANLDGYVDDVVITPIPSDMTLEQGLALYENYLAIRRNA